MLSVFGAVLVSLLGLAGSAVLLAFNSTIRSLAEKRPDSWFYWHIKFCDYLVRQTLLRPVFTVALPQPKALPSGEPERLDRLHDFAGVQDIIFVRRSFSVSIDLSKRIPTVFLKWVGQPVFPSIVVAILMGLIIIIAAYFLSSVVEKDILLLVMLVIELVGVILTIVVMFWRGSFFEVMQRLYYGPFLVIHIDEKVVSSDSSWGRWNFKNSSNFAFLSIQREFFLGISVTHRAEGESNPIEVFAYPRIFEDILLNGPKLEALCARLNALVAQARTLPGIEDIEHLSIAEPS